MLIGNATFDAARCRVSKSNESFTSRRGRSPEIRFTGSDVTYDLQILATREPANGDSLAPRIRLLIRCDEHGEVFSRIVRAPKGAAI